MFNKHVKDNSDSAARALPGDATRLHCRGDKPGIRPGSRVTFFASPKKVTKKRRPGDRAPAARGFPCQRYPERGAAKLAALRGAQTDAAPFSAPGTADTARSTGLHCNSNSNGNGNVNRNCTVGRAFTRFVWPRCPCRHVTLQRRSQTSRIPLAIPATRQGAPCITVGKMEKAFKQRPKRHPFYC